MWKCIVKVHRSGAGTAMDGKYYIKCVRRNGHENGRGGTDVLYNGRRMHRII